jgi:hypothetical protein
MGEAHLVPVAIARNIVQIKPVDGQFVGMSDDFLGLHVDVIVSQAAIADEGFGARTPENPVRQTHRIR